MPYFASGDSSVMKRGSIRLWGWISHPELCHSLSVSFLYPACKPNGVDDVIWNNILHVTLVTTVTKNISNKQATLEIISQKKIHCWLNAEGTMLQNVGNHHIFTFSSLVSEQALSWAMFSARPGLLSIFLLLGHGAFLIHNLTMWSLIPTARTGWCDRI